jgi:hypothetical protein
MSHQEAVTVRAWITPGALESLQAALQVVEHDVEQNELIPFAALDNVHFARFVIVPEARDVVGNVIPPSLVYAANVDGPGFGHLQQLLSVATAGVDRIFSHCEGYPPAATRNQQTRLGFLRARQIKTQAFYVNTVGRTARQVREEALLRDELERELDRRQKSGNWSNASPEQIRADLRGFVSKEAKLRFAQNRAPGLPLGYRIRERLTFFGTLLLFLVLSPLFLVALPFFVILLRVHEIRDAQRRQALRLSAEEQIDLRLREDQIVQNQISAVGNAKPGWFRGITLRALLWALDFASRHVFNRGDLGTFKILGLHGVDTIHFAQWIVIDEGRRVLFFSNYDGSLVSYMDDFVNKVAWGLNAVFSNGANYPKTNWLLLGGATDEQQFKAFLHHHQIPTQAWYSAHKRYTAVNLANNAEIRRGLVASGSASPWLARL